jgi:alginate O-acetyltransferase complex protein AlgI
VLAYTPSGVQVVLVVMVAIVSAFAAGFALSRLSQPQDGRLVAWIVFLGGTTAVERLTAVEPPGVRMLTLIAYALVALKGVVVVEERRRGLPPFSLARWAAFALGWPGMQPRLFARPRAGRLARAGALLVQGLASAALGVALVALARALWIGLESRLLASVALLCGLSCVLHFGAFNVLAGTWRAAGIPCDALFRAPWRSRSLSEFWARRWNLAFSEMTSIAAYRPLAERFGRPRALFAGFALSGLLHEMAISLPVMEGFGLPLLYFLLHGGLVVVERARADAGRPFGGWGGRVWTLLGLLAPLPLLFHRPFLAGVLWPLIGIPSEG